MSAGTATSIGVGQICEVCQQPLLERDPSHWCTSCGTPFHDECWRYVGGCAVYGCPQMYETRKADDGQILYWGVSEKRCAMCAETIPVGELQCPYCHTAFESVRPVSRDEMLSREPDEPRPAPLRRKAIIMLVWSVLGVTSPFVLLVGGVWYFKARRAIADEGPTTRAIALIALGVAVIYAVLIVLGALAFEYGRAPVGSIQ